MTEQPFVAALRARPGVLRLGKGGETMTVRVEIPEQWDVVRIPGNTWRALEGGMNGAELIAFGAPNTENKDADMKPGWWPES